MKPMGKAQVKWKGTLILALLAINLNWVPGACGYVFKTGSCRSIAPTVSGFSLNKFTGTWYVIQGTNSASRCHSITIKETNGSFSISVDKQLFSLLAAGVVHNLHYEAQIYPNPNDPAAMVLRLPSGLYSDITYEVIGTDYSNWAVLWSCKPQLMGHLESSLILSRTNSLPLDSLVQLREEMATVGVKLEDLSSVQQTDCNPKLGGGFFTLELASGLSKVAVDWNSLVPTSGVPGSNPNGCFIQEGDYFYFKETCPSAAEQEGVTTADSSGDYYYYYYYYDEANPTQQPLEAGEDTGIVEERNSTDKGNEDDYYYYYYDNDDDYSGDYSGDYYYSGEYYSGDYYSGDYYSGDYYSGDYYYYDDEYYDYYYDELKMRLGKEYVVDYRMANFRSQHDVPDGKVSSIKSPHIDSKININSNVNTLMEKTYKYDPEKKNKREKQIKDKPRLRRKRDVRNLQEYNRKADVKTDNSKVNEPDIKTLKKKMHLDKKQERMVQENHTNYDQENIRNSTSFPKNSLDRTETLSEKTVNNTDKGNGHNQNTDSSLKNMTARNQANTRQEIEIQRSDIKLHELKESTEGKHRMTQNAGVPIKQLKSNNGSVKEDNRDGTTLMVLKKKGTEENDNNKNPIDKHGKGKESKKKFSSKDSKTRRKKMKKNRNRKRNRRPKDRRRNGNKQRRKRRRRKMKKGQQKDTKKENPLAAKLIMFSTRLQKFLMKHNVNVRKIPKKLRIRDLASYFQNPEEKRKLLHHIKGAKKTWQSHKVKKTKKKGNKNMKIFKRRSKPEKSKKNKMKQQGKVKNIKKERKRRKNKNKNTKKGNDQNKKKGERRKDNSGNDLVNRVGKEKEKGKENDNDVHENTKKKKGKDKDNNDEIKININKDKNKKQKQNESLTTKSKEEKRKLRKELRKELRKTLRKKLRERQKNKKKNKKNKLGINRRGKRKGKKGKHKKKGKKGKNKDKKRNKEKKKGKNKGEAHSNHFGLELFPSG